MSALRLAVLVVLGTAWCVTGLTINPDTPECALLADGVKEHIEEKLTPVKAAIQDVKDTVEEVCAGHTAVVDVQAIPPPSLNGFGTAGLTARLETMEGELSEVKQTVAALTEQLEQKTKDLATLESVRDLKNTFVNLMRETLLLFDNQLEELPKRNQVEALVKGQTAAVKEAVRGVQDACGNGEKLDELAEDVRQVQGRVEEAKEAAQETRSKVDQCVQQQGVTGGQQDVGEKVEEVALSIEGLKSHLEAQILYIGGRVEELTNTTQTFVTALVEEIEREKNQTELAEPAPIYPCLDSTFTGSANATCELAVKFNRCSLSIVSYHCCRTCTDAGLLPETGPWRHQNMARTITTLQTIRFFAP